MYRLLLRSLMILVLAGGSGLLVNDLRGSLPLSRNAFLEPGDQEINVEQAKERLHHGALFLDARPRAFYEMSHIPGARSLPENDFDGSYQALSTLLRSQFDVIVYCSGFGCEASHDVARRLKARGIPAVVLQDGWPAWEEAHLPQRAGKDP